jgi:hypothetical protein
VALSRATSENGLQIENYYAGKVKAHPLAIAFFNALDADTITPGSMQVTLGVFRFISLSSLFCFL